MVKKWLVIPIAIAAIFLLFFYSYFVSDSVQTKITDAQMNKVDGNYMIATEYRPFRNHDARYRFKFDSGTVQNDAIRLKEKKSSSRNTAGVFLYFPSTKTL